MPQIKVVFYRDEKGAPVVEWLARLRESDRLAYAKCAARIRQLAALGHELRRPIADYLESGVYELRVRRGRVNYRILYFFYGQQVAVLSHAITKEDRLSKSDLKRAIERKKLFESKPESYCFQMEI